MGTRQVNRKRIRGTRHGLRRQRLALALAAAFSLPAAPVAAQSLPESGTVTQGTATINTAGNTMTIQQATHGAIIDWGSFNIAAGNTVNFVQPDASSVTLNRVIGFGSPSLIDGSLAANGSVFLVNPAGVVFGNGAQVNVGGLVASTLDIADDDFIAGLDSHSFHFESAVPPDGEVANSGTINAGGVAFLGPYLRNSGLIDAGTGNVLMLGAAAGADLTWDPSGTGGVWWTWMSTSASPSISLGDGSDIRGGTLFVAAPEGSIEVVGNVGFSGRDAWLEAVHGTVSVGRSDGPVEAGYLTAHTQSLRLRGDVVQVLGDASEQGRIVLLGDADGIATGMYLSAITTRFDAGVEVSAPGAVIETQGLTFVMDDTAIIEADTWRVYASELDIIDSGDTSDFSAYLTDGLLSRTLDLGTNVYLQASVIRVGAGVDITHVTADEAMLTFHSWGHIYGSGFAIESTGGALDIVFDADGGPVELGYARLTSNGGDIAIHGDGDYAGVELLRTSISSGDGDITIVGTASDLPVYYSLTPRGVLLQASSLSTTGGDIEVVGSATHGVGVEFASAYNESTQAYDYSSLTTVAGDITVISTGLTSLDVADVPFATDAGSIWLEGHATGSGPGLQVGSGGVTTHGGDITLVGGSFDDVGVLIAGDLDSNGGAITLVGSSADYIGVFLTGSDIQSDGGDIHLSGDTASQQVFSYGVLIAYSSSIASGGGDIDIAGTSVGGSGVWLWDTVLASSGGDISFRGTGAMLGGVDIVRSVVDSAGGDIEIRGSAAGSATGVSLGYGSVSSGEGDITIAGDNAHANSAPAVFLLDESLRSTTGNISLSGISAGGIGISVDPRGPAGTSIATTTGDITLFGRSANRAGVFLTGDLGSAGGAISITGANTAAMGTDNDDLGVWLDDARIVSHGGAVSIRGSGFTNGLSAFGSAIAAGAGSVEISGHGETGWAMYLQDFTVAASGGIRLEGVGTGLFGVSWWGGGADAGAGDLSISGVGGGLDFHDVDLTAAAVSLTGSTDAANDSGVYLDHESRVQATAGPVVVLASNGGGVDAIAFEGVIVSAEGVVLAPYNVDDTILLGSGNGFSLTAAELALIDSPLLVIGSAAHAGAIQVREAVAWDGDLTLQNQGGIGGIDLQAPVDVGDHVLALASDGDIGQTTAGPITAHSLLAIAGGNVALTAAGNNVAASSIAGRAGGDFAYEDVDDLAIGTVSGQGYTAGAQGLSALSASGIAAGGDVLVATRSGNLVMSSNVSGTNIDLVAAEVFRNATGASLVATGDWRVWSRTWEGEQRGGLESDDAFDLFGCSFGQECTGMGRGDRFIYREVLELPKPSGPVVAPLDEDEGDEPVEEVHAGMSCPVGTNAADPLGTGAGSDELAREWSKTRHRLRLSGCIDNDSQGGCRF